MLNDLLSGIVAVGVVFVLSLMTGGFSFYQPWILWSVIALFTVGLFRGNRRDSVWPKVLIINSSWIVLILFSVNDVWWHPVIGITATLVSTAGGVYLRRKLY